jgi:hypothetical protein
MYADRLTPIGEEADAEIKQLTDEKAALQAEYDAYKASHPDVVEPPLPDPPPKEYRLQLGYCPDPNTPAEVQRLGALSGAMVRRSYYSSGTSWPSTPTFAADNAAGLRTAHTIKVPIPGSAGVPNNMKTRLERLQSGTDAEGTIQYILKSGKNSIIGFEHEPEDDFAANPSWDKKLYREAQKVGGTYIDEANKRDGGNRKFAGNLMSSSKEAVFLSFFPGEGVWDIYGTDGYNWPNRDPNSKTIPPWVEFIAIFSDDKVIATKYGMKFAIFEFGCRKADLYHDANNSNMPTAEMSAKQVDWCTKARRDMLESIKPVVACNFHHDWWLMRDEGHLALGGK